MLTLLCRSVTPLLSLTLAIDNWQRLRRKLAEPPRRRGTQREQIRNLMS
jgi:hypothetical protein